MVDTDLFDKFDMIISFVIGENIGFKAKSVVHYMFRQR